LTMLVADRARGLINGLTEADFTVLRQSTEKGWESSLSSETRIPSRESLEDFLVTLREVANALDLGVLIPENLISDRDYCLMVAIFYAVNERYMRKQPRLDPLS